MEGEKKTEREEGRGEEEEEIAVSTARETERRNSH